jgi:predicted alpha/beta-hydrolase family hydrolase
VQGRHKLIVPTAADAAPELFDVVADPAEQQDLSADQPDRTTSLRASIVGEAARRAGARRPKNVLVFLTDDQRFDQMSCAGHPVLRTPNIDSLAARGVHLALEVLVQGVICLGYPLVGGGKTRALRDEVLVQLRTPVLFVQGTRDPLCPLTTLAEVRPRMTAASDLHIVEGGDHSLNLGKRALAARGQTQAEVDDETAAAVGRWISEHLPTSSPG